MFNARSALIVHAHAVLPQVNTEHLLLGLIEEDVLSKAGYLNSGMDAEKAKQAIEELTGKRKPVTSADPIVFSRGVRRTFEAATTVSGWLPVVRKSAPYRLPPCHAAPHPPYRIPMHVHWALL